MRQLRPGQSWSQLRRLVRNRHVQVNGNLCLDEGRKLKAGDVIKVWQEPRLPLPRAEDLLIRYQDKHLVVVEKPAGVTTLRHCRGAEPAAPPAPVAADLGRDARPDPGPLTARPWACDQRPAPAAGDPPRTPPRPRYQWTDGLCPLAPGRAEIGAECSASTICTAFTWQSLRAKSQAQTFESFLVRDRGDGLRGSTRLPGVGQRAVTHVRPLESLGGYTLVQCRLETGRTHQIRIHLAEAGHMVCGERIYNRPLGSQAIADRSGAQRQALHAAELGFAHPISGEHLSFVSPLPPDLDQLLARLRGVGA